MNRIQDFAEVKHEAGIRSCDENSVRGTGNSTIRFKAVCPALVDQWYRKKTDQWAQEDNKTSQHVPYGEFSLQEYVISFLIFPINEIQEPLCLPALNVVISML